MIKQPEDQSRPNVLAAGAMRTSNGTEAYMGAYMGYWLEEKLQTLTVAPDISVNLDFNGLGCR